MPVLFAGELREIGSSGGFRIRSALMSEYGNGREEEASCADGEQDDGVAIGSLGGWGSSSGVVAALGASLSASWQGHHQSCGK